MEIQSNEVVQMLKDRTLQQQKLGPEVVTKTLDNMNKNNNSLNKTDFEMQKDVLASAFGKGSIINIIA